MDEHELISLFLQRAVAHSERKFWIDRTYNRLLQFKLIDRYPEIPRALKQAPYLYVVAAYWYIETRKNRSPTRGELETIWYGLRRIPFEESPC